MQGLESEAPDATAPRDSEGGRTLSAYRPVGHPVVVGHPDKDDHTSS